MSVYETPPERKVIVLFEDINRLGVDPVFVSIFIIDVLRRRPNTELVSLRQFKTGAKEMYRNRIRGRGL